MFVPKRRPADGVIDLGDQPTRLHFVNRAHHALLANCNKQGWLSVSSSESVLRRHLEELSDAQVAEINNVLYSLGLRSSKPGGGDHTINISIRNVTLDQLLAGTRLPQATFDDMLSQEVVADGNPDDLLAAIQLAAEELCRAAEPIADSSYGAAIVRDHLSIIDGAAGDLFADVIHALKKLEWYRIYAFGADKCVCFVQPGRISRLTEKAIARGGALVKWPDEVEGLLSSECLVANMTSEQIITALAKKCEEFEAAYGDERRRRIQVEQMLAERDVQLADVVGAYEQLEGALTDAQRQLADL